MLVAASLEGVASSITFGNRESLEASVVQNHIQNLDFSEYKDQRVIVKGCSDISAAEVAFLELNQSIKASGKVTHVWRSMQLCASL